MDGINGRDVIRAVGHADGQHDRSRDSLFLMARLTVEGSVRDVRVRNLSPGGLMVELDRPADVGTAVMLDLRGIGEITGRIAWYAEGRAGVALDRQIDPRKARKPVGQGSKTPDYAKPPATR